MTMPMGLLVYGKSGKPVKRRSVFLIVFVVIATLAIFGILFAHAIDDQGVVAGFVK